jgi:hypothetical protein
MKHYCKDTKNCPWMKPNMSLCHGCNIYHDSGTKLYIQLHNGMPFKFFNTIEAAGKFFAHNTILIDGWLLQGPTMHSESQPSLIFWAKESYLEKRTYLTQKEITIFSQSFFKERGKIMGSKVI